MSLYYQDLLNVGESEGERIAFVKRAISAHKDSEEYKTAVIGYDYACRRNTTICNYQKMLYTISGKTVPDNWSANYKLGSNFLKRFVTQLNSYLLGNGITFNNEDTSNRLGDDFDHNVMEAGYEALIGAVSFGFWNYDHLEVFNIREYAPLYDEENGALMAGIRFWQVEDNKPLRATLYELDGYTEYIWNRRKTENGDADYIGEVLRDKRPYKQLARVSVADGEEIYDGENYDTFPIIPLYANKEKQAEIVGMRENIDAYDFIKSGFANDLDDASQIYWTITNAGGMDDIDLAQFLEKLKRVKAATVDDGEQVQSHTVEPPYAGREAALALIRSDLYDDFMALDTKAIASGAVTATQIEAAYEPLNQKADAYEYQVTKFIKGILKVAGIDDTPSYTRSVIVNKGEEIERVIQGAMFLTQPYCTKKILTLIGDADQYDDIQAEIDKQNMANAGMLEENPEGAE